MSVKVSANKNLGQHFLRDQKIIETIANDFAKVSDALIEVGPGPAVLTPTLAGHKIPFHVIEKDERFPEILVSHVKEQNIHLTDALEVDYSQFIHEHFPDSKNVWLVSNLPYNVGTPLTILFLKCPSIKYMTLMYQKEVAEKVYSFQRKEDNAANSLGALLLTYFDVKLLLKVPPGAFSPPPKVDSVVLSYVRIENPVIPFNELNKFEKFLRALFAQKRKQMGNVLKATYSNAQLSEAFVKNNLTSQMRAEVLTLEQIQQLYRTLHPMEQA